MFKFVYPYFVICSTCRFFEPAYQNIRKQYVVKNTKLRFLCNNHDPTICVNCGQTVHFHNNKVDRSIIQDILGMLRRQPDDVNAGFLRISLSHIQNICSALVSRLVSYKNPIYCAHIRKTSPDRSTGLGLPRLL